MSIIRIEDVAYARFSVPDVPRMHRFLLDFGLLDAKDGQDASRRILYMRGAGESPVTHISEEGPPGFLAIGMRAASLHDLERLARSENVGIESLDAPGGGHKVCLVDPDGFRVEVVAGQISAKRLSFGDGDTWNFAGAVGRNRRTKRINAGPAHVVRLGHVVFAVSDVRATERWWKDRFGVLASDEVVLPDGQPMALFMRCDRGATPTDHHSLNFAKMPNGKAGFHHAAFEVRDFDDLVVGGEHLAKKSYSRVWGIGRHILGSQVFDYWTDPWGHRLEHWTDGDQFTDQDPTQVVGVDQMLGIQWGPAPAASFVE